MYEEQSAITCFPLFTVVTVSKFQALIGIHQTYIHSEEFEECFGFQALIGIHQTFLSPVKDTSVPLFQALIGIHQTWVEFF